MAWMTVLVSQPEDRQFMKLNASDFALTCTLTRGPCLVLTAGGSWPSTEPQWKSPRSERSTALTAAHHRAAWAVLPGAWQISGRSTMPAINSTATGSFPASPLGNDLTAERRPCSGVPLRQAHDAASQAARCMQHCDDHSMPQSPWNRLHGTGLSCNICNDRMHGHIRLP